ncbi:MAG: zinc ribbon domain-containing protein [Desulfatitalea sp.]
MPIYEFKCLKCHEYVEILVMGAQDSQVEMKCSQCGSENLERILSTTNFNLAGGGSTAAASGPSTQARSCSGGSCTTWNLPGHSR